MYIVPPFAVASVIWHAHSSHDAKEKLQQEKEELIEALDNLLETLALVMTKTNDIHSKLVFLKKKYQ